MDEQIEFLRETLEEEDWWKSKPTLIKVAQILDEFGVLEDKEDVIHFFEKPKSFEMEIEGLIEGG